MQSIEAVTHLTPQPRLEQEQAMCAVGRLIVCNDSFQYLSHQVTPSGNVPLAGQCSGFSSDNLQLPAIFSTHKQSSPE